MSEPKIFTSIRKEIDENEVLLFMKGSPKFPQCGFSAAVCHILNTMGVQYKGVNVLDDQEMREGIKQYSDWPTIPQLYIKGEFVGGCDIVKEMTQSGELQSMLQQKGIKVRVNE